MCVCLGRAVTCSGCAVCTLYTGLLNKWNIIYIQYCNTYPISYKNETLTRIASINSFTLVYNIIIIYINICFRSERRLVALVAMVRMQFPVRQRATEEDQSVQQPSATQRGQTLPRAGGE